VPPIVQRKFELGDFGRETNATTRSAMEMFGIDGAETHGLRGPGGTTPRHRHISDDVGV